MKVLSVRQPWAWLIVHGLKDIENRSWSTRFRGTVLIHAGKQFDADGEIGVRLKFPDLSVALPEQPQDYGRGGIVGMVDIVDCVTESDSPWFMGEYGFVMRNARPLPFFPMRGALGFFDAPADFKLAV